MGCNSSKGPRPDQSRAPKLQPPAGRPAPAPQSLIRVKLVLLGATGVGKSCLVLRYVKGLFESASRVTVGAAFLAHSVALPDGRTVKFEIWDTAGQERYASLAPLYYRGAGAAVVMYDITSAETFTKAKYWVTELQKNAPGNLVIVLAGNKSDLAEARKVSTEEGQAYAASNAMMFLETSAKTAANVAAVFDAIAHRLAGAGGPPSGPSIPALQNAPPPISTRAVPKASGRNAPQAPSSKKAAQPPSDAPTPSPASKTAPQEQAPEQQQASADSLPSNKSTASMASDAASDPLPPSSDAAVLDAASLSRQPHTQAAAIHTAGFSPSQAQQAADQGKRVPDEHAEPPIHDRAADAGSKAGPPDALPAAPQKAEARAGEGDEAASATGSEGPADSDRHPPGEQSSVAAAAAPADKLSTPEKPEYQSASQPDAAPTAAAKDSGTPAVSAADGESKQEHKD